MLALFLAPQAAVGEVSGVSLIEQLHADLMSQGKQLTTHRQKYSRAAGRLRKLLQVDYGAATQLTPTTTAPIRFKLDYSSLYPASAPKYSACFNVGDWFHRGLPEGTMTPPANGVETCMRGPGERINTQESCWGKCQPRDIISDAGREMLMAVTTTVANEFSDFLGVIPVASNLTFAVNTGSYGHALTARGYTPTASCVHDCTLLSGVSVNERTYCQEGVSGVDAILSVTKPPGVHGIAGTGSSCASDQNGRPLWLVFSWHSDLADLVGTSLASNLDKKRALVVHEILHTLGFSNSMFNYARDSQGQRKNLLELKAVTDVDGATDNVWHFVKGRAFEMAQRYFNCSSNVTSGPTAPWLGLPLMGLPEAGRGSHWETRVMRDDVMSYGHNDAVSAITLAAMEDLGFYLANYSAASCMLWGFQQGCEYVKTRCGVNSHARTSVTTGRNLCYGSGSWDKYTDDYLLSKCAGGLNPCDTTAEAGYVELAGGSKVCDMQCYTGPGAFKTCATPPSTNPEGTSMDRILDQLKDIDWKEWLILGLWVLGGILIIGCVRKIVCPTNRKAAKWIAVSLDSFLVLLGVGALVLAAIVWFNYDAFQAFLGKTTIIVFAIGGAVFLLWSLLMMLGLCCNSTCLLAFGFWSTILATLLQIAATLLIVYWIYSLGHVPLDALTTVLGDAKQSIDNALSVPLSWAEGMVCVTYQQCCKPYELGGLLRGNVSALTDQLDGVVHNGTCFGDDDHTIDVVQSSLRDPAQHAFCYFVTGAPANSLAAPPPITCSILESISDFRTATCQATFCQAGTDGYMSFLTQMIELLKRYALPIGIIFAALVVMQWILACNLRTARWHILEDRADARAAPPGYAGATGYAAGVQAVHVQAAKKRANSGALRRARKGQPKDPKFTAP